MRRLEPILFPGKSARAVLAWYFCARGVVASCRALSMEPREVQTSLRFDHMPDAMERVLIIGQCLDRLNYWQRKAIETGFSIGDDDPAWKSRSFKEAFGNALARVSRIMRRDGVIE